MTEATSRLAAPAHQGERRRAKVAIVVVAYNAVSTLARVLDRIAEEVWERVEEVIVFDDASQDATYLVALGFREHTRQAKLRAFRNERNLGYGGNQKRAYRYAIDQGYDVVALLHGDGQYAPELLPTLLEPLERGEADAVFGSRMLEPGRARAGGMPLYKYLGNRVLTGIENFALGMRLSEFHSGYRLYSLAALAKLPFERNSDDFHFDTQIIIQMHAAGQRIVERPIPTYYGDEICYVNGLAYARNVVGSVARFKLHELGLLADPAYDVRVPYHLKQSPLGSHAQIAKRCGSHPRRIIDVGCGTGELARLLEEQGHDVTAVDAEPPTVSLRRFVQADLSSGLPALEPGAFDVAILADVLEHLAEPAKLLADVRAILVRQGMLLVSVPNAVHWSVRAQIASGQFDYANRGILDRGHLRFFTSKTAERLLATAGFDIVEQSSTPVPWEHVVPPALGPRVPRALEGLDARCARLAPNLFAYQHLFVARKRD